MKDGSRRLVVGTDEAVNYIFGRGRIGATNGLGRDLRKLREVLGPDSKEWKMVREEAFLRLFKGMPESGPFPAEKFSRNLETALVESRDTVGVLFTQPEIAMMGQLKGVALNANTVPAITANVNRSGTAIAQRLIDQFGPVGRGAQIAVTRLLAPFVQLGRNQAAGNAARGVLPAARPAATPGAGGIGPGMTADPAREYINRQLEDKLLRQGK